MASPIKSSPVRGILSPVACEKKVPDPLKKHLPPKLFQAFVKGNFFESSDRLFNMKPQLIYDTEPLSLQFHFESDSVTIDIDNRKTHSLDCFSESKWQMTRFSVSSTEFHHDVKVAEIRRKMLLDDPYPTSAESAETRALNAINIITKATGGIVQKARK